MEEQRFNDLVEALHEYDGVEEVFNTLVREILIRRKLIDSNR